MCVINVTPSNIHKRAKLVVLSKNFHGQVITNLSTISSDQSLDWVGSFI